MEKESYRHIPYYGIWSLKFLENPALEHAPISAFPIQTLIAESRDGIESSKMETLADIKKVTEIIDYLEWLGLPPTPLRDLRNWHNKEARKALKV